jgi:hypothetical protein
MVRGDPALLPEDEEDLDIVQNQKLLFSIFLFSNPRSYYHTVEFAIFLQCVDIALW